MFLLTKVRQNVNIPPWEFGFLELLLPDDQAFAEDAAQWNAEAVDQAQSPMEEEMQRIEVWFETW